MDKTFKYELAENIDYERMFRYVGCDQDKLKEIFNGNDSNYDEPKKVGRKFDKFKQARELCKKLLLSKGKHKATYSVAEQGRLYGSQTVSIQKTDIRGYLLGHDYLNFDIINCIPSIYLYLANTNKIKVPILQHLVEDRAGFLKKYKTKKGDLAKVWNEKKDAKPKKWSGSLIPFRDDIIYLAKELKTDLWGLLKMGYTIETAIMEDIYEKIVKFDIFDKDGFYIRKDTLKSADLTAESMLKKINIKLFIQYKKVIKMKIKPIEGIDIELPEVENDGEAEIENSYEAMKIKVDEQLFLTKNPPTLWYRSKTEEKKTEFHQININNLKIQLADLLYDEVVFTKEGTKIIKLDVFNRWVKDPTRRKYEGVKFMPYPVKNEDPLKKNNTFFNTFEGLDIWEYFENQEEFIKDWSCEKEQYYIDIFKKYMNHLVGGGTSKDTENKYNYLMNYFADMLQNPQNRPDVYILLKGEQGSGKDTLYIILNKLLGMKHSIKSEDPEYIFGHFNADLASKVLICINELEAKDGHRFSAKIKAQTTNDYNQINAKNKDIIREINIARYIIFSNKKYPTNIEYTGRREMVCNTGKELLGDKNFWTKLYSCMAEIDFTLAIYKMLMKENLNDIYKDQKLIQKKFNPRQDRPLTKEYKQMRDKNIPTIYKFLNDECLRLNEIKREIDEKNEKIPNIEDEIKIKDDELLWIWDNKKKFWGAKLVNFRQSYTAFYKNLPYFDEATQSERKKWIHFENEGDISNLNDTGLKKRKIQYTNNEKVKVYSEIWVLKPNEIISYFNKINLFNTDDDEEVYCCDDEFGKELNEMEFLTEDPDDL